MVYDYLVAERCLSPVPLCDETGNEKRGILVGATLSGVQILATCRRLNQEVGPILRPTLLWMLRFTPTIRINAKDLIAIVPRGGRSNHGKGIIHKILTNSCSKSALQTIHEYRDGKKSLTSIRSLLHISKQYPESVVRALASFILRVAKFAATTATTLGRPPFAITIERPAAFTAVNFTWSISPIRRFVARYIRRQPLPRTGNFLASFVMIVEYLAFRIFRICTFDAPGMSVALVLRLTDRASTYGDLALVEEEFKSAITHGITIAAVSPEHNELVTYGGLLTREGRGMLFN
jgi:hypothetical protein